MIFTPRVVKINENTVYLTIFSNYRPETKHCRDNTNTNNNNSSTNNNIFLYNWLIFIIFIIKIIINTIKNLIITKIHKYRRKVLLRNQTSNIVFSLLRG